MDVRKYEPSNGVATWRVFLIKNRTGLVGAWRGGTDPGRSILSDQTVGKGGVGGNKLESRSRNYRRSVWGLSHFSFLFFHRLYA